jgi:hypothetical protein
LASRAALKMGHTLIASSSFRACSGL